MLNKSNSAEWLAGWQTGVDLVTKRSLAEIEAILNELWRWAGNIRTAWTAGYVAALSAAVGVL